MSSGRHHLAADPPTMGRRSAFNSLRKMPSTLFRSEKQTAPTDDNPSSMRDRKKPRRRPLAGLLGRGKNNVPPVPSPPSAWAAETLLKKPPPVTIPENKQRPSCGPDPFVRPVPEGVRVIQHAHSPPPKPTSVKIMEAERHRASRSFKRQSVTSSLRGIQVISIDEVDNLDDPLIDDDGAALASLVNSQGAPIRQPALPSLTADELPLRNSSLGSWPMSSQLRRLAQNDEPTPSTIGAPVETVVGSLADAAEVPKPSIGKEKTRSKVWGVLSGRRQSKSKAKSEASASKTQPSQGAGRSSNSEPTRPPSRTRPPTLHVTHPSLDQQVPFPTAPARQVIEDPDSPFVSRKPNAAPKAPTPLLDQIRQSSDSYASRATSRKSVPRRKSLSGLFGITFQKSMDKLRSGSPLPAMPEAPSTPSRMSVHANVMEDTSPDTLAFYSRQGIRTGFNGHGNLLHPDALIHDVASANTHLHELVAHMDVSPTTTRSRGAPGTPTPLRRQQSSLLIARPTTASSRSTTPSPAKSIIRPIGKVFERDGGSKSPNGSRPSSPVKTMVRGMRNIFASSPSRLSAKVSPSHFRPGSVASDISDTSASTNHIVIQVGEQGNGANRRSGLDVPHDVNDRPSPESARTATPRAPPPPPSAFSFGHTRIGSKPPTLDLDLGTSSRPTSMFSDMFNHLNSSKLSMASNASSSLNARDSNRNTFDFAKELAALKASDDTEPVDDTLRIARSIELSTESPRYALSQLEEVLESRKNSAETLRGRKRRSNPPFQGDLAFQLNVARSRITQLPPPGPPPPFALPPTPQAVRLDGDHKKQPSAISFASMSSLGTPLVHIDRGHTSYIEQVFAAGSPLRPLPNTRALPKARTESNHHRRMSSGLSIDSVTLADISTVTGRSVGSARGHCRESSISSTVGRSDWAHQRRTSTDSVGSVARLRSIARLGRPGIGDRMFESNGFGDDEDSDAEMSALASPTFGTRPYSYGSTEETHEPGSTEESFFGTSDLQRQRSFSIKGRPLSTASVESNVNDTFDYIDGPSKRAAVEADIIGRYENDSMRESPVVKDTAIKPRARHRPPHLHLHDRDDDTPGLISPSDLTDLTESSSLFSIDTARTSNPPPGYPSHSREKGSITSIVHVQPTIREEASQATIRGDGTEAHAEWEGAQDWHIRKWDQAGHGDHPSLSRSPSYTNLTNEPPMPRSTRAEIDAILADSMAKYKPLAETAVGNVHRRKTSLNNTRSIAAPYGLAGPAPFETRFQNKRAGMSSENVSPLLAAFARDVVPLPPLPSALRPEVKPAPDASAAASASAVDVRTRVPSSVRRDNLGWGRRRHSDEPTTREPSVILRKKPASATQPSFPSFLAFSPAPPPEPLQEKTGHPKSKPMSSRQTQPKAPRTSSGTTKPFYLAPPALPLPLVTAAKHPKPTRKRIHVKTDSKGSPVSVHSLPRDLVPDRPDSAPAPLTSRGGNVAKPTRPALHKTKSSPEARRVNKKKSMAKGKENVRGAYVLPAVPRRPQHV